MARNLWILFSLITYSYGFVAEYIVCPNPNYCTCDHSKVICIGKDPTSTMAIGIFHPEDHAPLLKISGFHTVNLRFHFLQGARPNTVIISNITNLSIDTLAFAGSAYMDYLEISHIDHLTAGQFSLYQITDNKKVIFRNVKIRSLATYAISIENAEYLNIDDCEFDTISSNSFKTSNITRVIINNTLVRSIESDALVIFGIDLAESLTLQNVSIENVSTKSLVIVSTPEVRIMNCNFGSLNPKFVFGTDIDTFSFIGNVINNTESNIFENMNATHLIVKKNSFLNIQNESLTLHTTQESLSFEMNAFDCSCDTWWLWDASETFLQNNECHASADFTSSVRLADLEPMWTKGKGSTCSGLQLKKSQKSAGGGDKKEKNADFKEEKNVDDEKEKKATSQKGQPEGSKLHSDSVSLLELRSFVLMIFISFFNLFAM